jgi:hypothetical protein
MRARERYPRKCVCHVGQLLISSQRYTPRCFAQGLSRRGALFFLFLRVGYISLTDSFDWIIWRLMGLDTEPNEMGSSLQQFSYHSGFGAGWDGLHGFALSHTPYLLYLRTGNFSSLPLLWVLSVLLQLSAVLVLSCSVQWFCIFHPRKIAGWRGKVFSIYILF